MATATLNLARKWRSQQFATIIGQDIAVRMLKNGLYRDLLFPVYLLSGQRGCGKTSTARVFSAAINCEQLPNFRLSPKTQELPCGQCASCKAMQTGSHPDFIEIDAASHTGVDHVRQIIEAASLLPVLGRKKIYLIDEAHMLSKAAFNALLKILEEPPASVLFMLATTDQEKIIETVRSRCFQLFFTPVSPTELAAHLQKICQEEQIQFEDEALRLIVKESEGSVRDAINLLEQVRLSAANVTAESVRTVLGRMSEEQLAQLLTSILLQSAAELLETIHALNIAAFAPEKIYDGLIELIRQAMEKKSHTVQLPKVSLHRLLDVLETLYSYELPFSRTTKKHRMLEFILLKCTHEHDGGSGSSTPIPSAKKMMQEKKTENGDLLVSAVEPIEHLNEDTPNSENTDPFMGDQVGGGAVQSGPWPQFLSRIDELGDPLVRSIFNQAAFNGMNDANVIELLFPEQSAFFIDWLKDTTNNWLPLIKEIFGAQATLTAKLSATIAAPIQRELPKPTKPLPAIQPKAVATVRVPNGMPARKWQPKREAAAEPAGKKIDITDKEQWQKTNLVLSYFPGTVTEL